jgi:uncharacterized protein
VKTRVFDSWPILEWMFGRDPVRALVAALWSEAEAGRAYLLMSAINVCEVYYFLVKRGHSAIAEHWRQRTQALPMRVDVPKGEHIWAAANLKAKFPISYADAFAAELGQRHKCAVITGDPEFRSVAGLELDWVGR